MAGTSKAVVGQKVNSYYDLFLNQETYRYIFRILAFKIIVENPEQYGFVLSEKDKYKPFDTKTIKINRTIPDLAQFAIQHRTNYKTLKLYNPWLNSEDYSLLVVNGKEYELRLPNQ
jgi:hypothetical protein